MREVGTMRRRQKGGAAAEHAAASHDGIALDECCGVDPNRHNLSAEGLDVNSQSEVTKKRSR
jgi:hypothetical protein